MQQTPIKLYNRHQGVVNGTKLCIRMHTTKIKLPWVWQYCHTYCIITQAQAHEFGLWARVKEKKKIWESIMVEEKDLRMIWASSMVIVSVLFLYIFFALCVFFFYICVLLQRYVFEGYFNILPQFEALRFVLFKGNYEQLDVIKLQLASLAWNPKHDIVTCGCFQCCHFAVITSFINCNGKPEVFFSATTFNDRPTPLPAFSSLFFRR